SPRCASGARTRAARRLDGTPTRPTARGQRTGDRGQEEKDTLEEESNHVTGRTNSRRRQRTGGAETGSRPWGRSHEWPRPCRPLTTSCDSRLSRSTHPPAPRAATNGTPPPPPP